MITQDKIQHYIDEIEHENSVVSTSHITLRNLYDRYGYTQVDDAIDRYWFNKREEL